MLNRTTSIYHVVYTQEIKEICLFFWGCNIECRGCYCKRRIYSPMLKDFLKAHLEEPEGLASPPERFLTIAELIELLDGYDFQTVLFEGQEASLDHEFAHIARLLKERYGCKNVLLTNCYQLPDVSFIDKVEVGLKAVSDELHRHYTGVSNASIINNFKSLQGKVRELFVESVLIPDYIGFDEIESIARFIATVDPSMLLVILPYFKSGDNPWRRPTPTEMAQAAERAKKHLKHVFYFRGDEELRFEVANIFPSDIQSVLPGLSDAEGKLCLIK